MPSLTPIINYGGGGSLRVPARETIGQRWPAWERPEGPPAADIRCALRKHTISFYRMIYARRVTHKSIESRCPPLNRVHNSSLSNDIILLRAMCDNMHENTIQTR